MADNTVIPVGAGGDTIATDDIGGVKHQRVKVEFGADGSATDVSATNPLPASISQNTPGTTNGVQINALTYPQSTGNNSTVQLASGATFTGTIETVLSLQAAQVMVTCDQPYTVFVDQFIDLAGTKLVATYTFTRLTGVALNENVTLPSNYARVRVQNTGASTTSTFELNTTFGIMNTQPNTLSNSGNLRVVSQENGVVSTVNSTSSNLGASAVFTGAAEDVTEFSTLMVSAFSSHASATDGLSVQFSSDGTNWDFTDTYTIPAATGKTFSFGVTAKFYRLVYTNGGTLTTSLRVQTLGSRTPKKFSSQRPQDARTNDNDFEENLSYLMAYNGSNWDRLRSTLTGRLAVDTDSKRLVTYRGRASTFRIPGRAGTTGQKLFSIHNATGSTILVDVDKIKIDLVQTVVKAVTVLPPVVRLYRATVLPTNGTAVTKVARDSSQSSNAALTLLQDASADGTSSGTALTATLVSGGVLEGEFAQRLITAAGYEVGDAIEFLRETDETVTLRPLEGLVVMLDYVLATQNPVTDMWVVTCKWAEYTAV